LGTGFGVNRGCAMSQANISVIIPTKNRSQHLKNCLKSFSGVDGVELIVVDDGSDESDQKLNEKLCGQIENCSYYHSSPSGGAPKARNYGLSVSSGLYIWFFDDDDEVAPDTVRDISLLASGLKGDDFKVFLLPKLTVDNGEEVSYILPKKELNTFDALRKHGHQVNTSCTIFSRNLLSKLDGWDESLVAGQDTDLFLRASRECDFEPLSLEAVTVKIGHPGRIGKNIIKQQVGKIQFLEKHWPILATRRKVYYLATLVFWVPLLKQLPGFSWLLEKRKT